MTCDAPLADIVPGTGPAAADDNAMCAGRLGRDAKGSMSVVTADWRNDFLGLNQPAGFYAAHIARLRLPDCPPGAE